MFISLTTALPLQTAVPTTPFISGAFLAQSLSNIDREERPDATATYTIRTDAEGTTVMLDASAPSAFDLALEFGTTDAEKTPNALATQDAGGTAAIPGSRAPTTFNPGVAADAAATPILPQGSTSECPEHFHFSEPQQKTLAGLIYIVGISCILTIFLGPYHVVRSESL
ncbi:hypothetical protein B0H11DRAFT_2114658 [Mycena galericulata]|nr:hypothetical protein B0H11DRAFT_2114658 [Mycena galericulata]